MNLKPQRQDEPEVSLTPLIDVVFLLLIFFMVSTTFRKESELEIVLPQASQEPVAQQGEQIIIAIDAQGRYAVNDQLLPDQQRQALINALEQAAGSRRQLPIVIRADGQTAHQSVVTALDVTGQLGFKRIGIVTLNKVPAAL